MRRPIIAALLSTAVALGPWAHAADPQVIDVAGDGNLTGQALPAGNQAYADVVSTKWESATLKGKPAFKVTLTLTGPPTPPSGTAVVYRALGVPSNCGFFGVVYYTSKSSDKTIPQSAVRDNCVAETTRLTEIPLPEIKESVITWTVPLSVIPADAKIGKGTSLNNLFTTVNGIQDFRGVCLPSQTPVYGAACGLGAGLIDEAKSDKSFKL
ncbi:MAG TPA: hypothetical protein VNA12_09565 [Mycobacteriales bacterium]|nr:hypothetical protein [Mycobacteriales bacterium]